MIVEMTDRNRKGAIVALKQSFLPGWLVVPCLPLLLSPLLGLLALPNKLLVTRVDPRVEVEVS